MQNVAYFWSFRCMHIFGGYSLTRYSYFARAEMVGISSLIPCFSYFHDRRVKPEIVQSCARNAIAQNLLFTCLWKNALDQVSKPCFITLCFSVYSSRQLCPLHVSKPMSLQVNTTARSRPAGVAVPLCLLLHPAVQLAVPDLHSVSIWHRSLLTLNESRMVKWATKLSIQNHKTAFLNSTIE